MAKKSGSLKIHLLKIKKLLLHTVVTSIYLGCYIYAVYVLWISDDVNLQHEYIVKGKKNTGYFLSLWVLAAETIYFCSYSLVDTLELYYIYYNSEKALLMGISLKIMARYILFSVVFPMSVVVGILFWGLYIYDRDIIYPKVVDEIFPQFINHMMHTYPVPLSIIYMFVEIQMKPPKQDAFLVLSMFIFTYSLVFVYANYNCVEWVYPALEALTPCLVNAIVVFTLTSPYMFLFVGYYIYSKIEEMRSYWDSRFKTSKIC